LPETCGHLITFAEELPVFESKILNAALAFLRFFREMNANVRSEVSIEQTTHPITQRRKLLQLRESHWEENRRKFLKCLEEFGEPLQIFGLYDKPQARELLCWPQNALLRLAGSSAACN
jgi:hypothetical protein